MQAVTLPRRLAIIGYDALLLIALLFAATAALLPFSGGQGVPSGEPVYRLYLLLISFLYYAWFWTHGGQTLGMKTWRARVQNEDGSSLSWNQAVARYSAAWLSWACLGLGFFWSLIEPDKRCWHDRLSKSLLLHIPK